MTHCATFVDQQMLNGVSPTQSTRLNQNNNGSFVFRHFGPVFDDTRFNNFCCFACLRLVLLNFLASSSVKGSEL